MSNYLLPLQQNRGSIIWYQSRLGEYGHEDGIMGGVRGRGGDVGIGGVRCNQTGIAENP